MNKEIGLTSLDDSFKIKPIMKTNQARRKSQALPMHELEALGLGEFFKKEPEELNKSSRRSKAKGNIQNYKLGFYSTYY